MFNEKVSVLIPVLNGAPFLEQALISLKNQSYGCLEVLVWDNGSTDGTIDILKDWIPARLPGKIFVNMPLSLGLSLRRLVEAADSELCVRMDADDICLPEKIEKQVLQLSRRPKLALVGTDRKCIDMAGNILDSKTELPYEPSDVLHSTLIGPRILHPSVLFRKTCILAAGNYQDHSNVEEPYWSEDYDLWMRLQSKYLAETIPEDLLLYRINPDGVTQKAMREKRAALSRRRVWERSAAEFTGLQHEEALKLHDQNCHFMLPYVVRMARHFTRLDGLSLFGRLTKPSFLGAVSKFVNSQDIVSRVFLKLLAMRSSTK